MLYIGYKGKSTLDLEETHFFFFLENILYNHVMKMNVMHLVLSSTLSISLEDSQKKTQNFDKTVSQSS